MQWRLPKELEGKTTEVSGVVVTVPKQYGSKTDFVFKTVVINNRKVAVKLKLSWYRDVPALNVGDRWVLKVRLKRPHGLLNPGAFDLEKYLFIHHIRATGYVVNSEDNKVLEWYWYYYPFTRLRQFLVEKLEYILTNTKVASIIVALTTGESGRLSNHQWQVFRNSGTSHLVAISGLHIGLVASFVYFLIQFVWRFLSRLPLVFPARKAGVIGGLLFGLLYAAVSGFSVPAQRASVMLLVFSVLILLNRSNQAWRGLLYSLFIVLVINPLAVLTAGFWLSFTAVAAIIYTVSCRIKQTTGKFFRFWYLQIVVTLALLPISLFFFQQISLVSILANMVAMPAICFLVVPASLLGILFLSIPGVFGNWILIGAAKLLEVVWCWLEFLSTFSNSNWYHAVSNYWVLMSAVIGICLLFAPRGFPARSLGVVYFLPLFLYIPPQPNIGEFWFTVLDVGQGLATVIQTKNHVLIYDAGPKLFNSDAGANVIVPYLRQNRINSIDQMVISHGDNDHIGGAFSILDHVSVKNIITSVPQNFQTHDKVTKCYAAQKWRWDEVNFEIIFPDKNLKLQGNNGSCVLKVGDGENSILLTGDIEKIAENHLVTHKNTALKSTALVAPHHGSRTSSTKEFIGLVDPDYVIFPVGWKNRFRFPHKSVVFRYLELGAKLLNVSQTGAITFKFSDKSAILEPLIYRKLNKRLWHES